MLLAGADLLVGKAGGATVAEACALGRAMVIVDPYPGQEEDNAAWLARHDAALFTRGPASAVVAVDAVLASTRLRSRLAAAARALGRPHAADAIIDRTLAHLGITPLALAS
jgi:processive 1,2-diacylglycerol beta-glucosyltransferase